MIFTFYTELINSKMTQAKTSFIHHILDLPTVENATYN